MKYLSHYMAENQTKLKQNIMKTTKEKFEQAKKLTEKLVRSSNIQSERYYFVLRIFQNTREELNKELEIIRLSKITKTKYQESVIKDVNDNGANGIIKREYFNYETQITGDLSDMKDFLAGYIELFPTLFTEEIILTEAKKCYNLALINDWF